MSYTCPIWKLVSNPLNYCSFCINFKHCDITLFFSLSFLGSYFARDAQYSHNYCVSSAKIKSMFVARVLVGDFVRGNPTYNRPPAKPTNSLTCYDSCVDNPSAPSIFIIFEKHQIYPEYIIHYEEEKKCAIA